MVVGGFWGDEGKGKISCAIAKQKNAAAAVRAGTGPNAGHTVVYRDQTYKLRLMPSGFVAEDAKILIGAGVLVHIDILLKEIELTGVKDRFIIDNHTGIITDEHIEQEKENNYLMGDIGSTGSGSGLANVARVLRKMKLAKEYDVLKQYLGDVSEIVNNLLDEKKTVVVEGSQATFLSLYHGTYPYVTSKDVCASAALSDIGVGPTRADEVVVVFKAFITRVGEGELEGELPPEEVEKRGWQEYGTVTGRLRRAAPFNYELAKKAVRLNGATALAITKMDILFPELEGATDFSEVKGEALEFVEKIEKETGVKVKYLSTGPDTDAIIIR